MSSDFVYKNPMEAFGGTGFTYKPADAIAKGIFESTPSDEAQITALADQQLRSAAMSAALTWVEQGDYSFAALSDGLMIIADADESGDVDEEENAYLNDLLQTVADAFVSMGADPKNVSAFLDDGDDEAGATLGAFLSDKLADVSQSDDDLIVQFATGGDLILESMVKAVRDGQVVLVKKHRFGFHAKLSSAQRAGLKKARAKAFTGAARMARKRSMRIRKKKGL